MADEKKARRRITPAERIKDLDERISKARATLEKLEGERTAFVIETKRIAAEMVSQLGTE